MLLVDKPAGVTSHDVVAVARRALGTRRIGHAGTLDPFATGLLVLLLGRGTRLLPYIEGEPKVYEASIRFGAETSTDDPTGEVVREAAPPTSDAVRHAIETLTGPIDQRPPAYSAKQVGGTRAYAAARRGVPLDLSAVRVVVHDWTVRTQTLGTLEATITCSGGTYIRALARDLGRAAGSAAHLVALRRTRSGVFDVVDAVTLRQLQEGAHAVRGLRAAIPTMPVQPLTDDELRRVLHGNAVPARVPAPVVALLDPSENLVALARREGESLCPRVVLRDA